mmetsp:Transcript_152384/g.265624  ORF Transcript_152384/g.265624 Transcript_152384/m.265624 type:complete len:99 (-) Transcript_152384:100-396(-)
MTELAAWLELLFRLMCRCKELLRSADVSGRALSEQAQLGALEKLRAASAFKLRLAGEPVTAPRIEALRAGDQAHAASQIAANGILGHQGVVLMVNEAL